MEEFLRKIKLIDDMSTRLNVSTPEFVSALRKDVQESDIDNVFSGFLNLEVFSSDKRKYKGKVDNRGFNIRKKRKFFQKNKDSINIKGTYRSSGDILIVNTTISAFSFKKFIFMNSVLICYLIFIFHQFKDSNLLQNFFNDIPVFTVFILIGMPLFIWYSKKQEVANMKKDLENQFQTISSKINHLK